MRDRRPIRNGLLASLVILICWLPRPAFSQYTYETALAGKKLVEGLGFEGAVTVYDDTPRMFRRLGKPRTLPRYPSWYFYDQGRYKLTIKAAFINGQHRVTHIQYGNDKRRHFVTSTGISLGDGLARVTKVYGDSAQIRTMPGDKGERRFSYADRGIAFNISKAGQVVSIIVFRASIKTKSEADKDTGADGNRSLVKPDRNQLKTLSDIGIKLPVPEHWSSVVPITESGGSYSPPQGRVSLSISACSKCATSLKQRVQKFEAQYAANRVPVDMRVMTKDDTSKRAAEAGYWGVYTHQGGIKPVWMIGLSRGSFNVLIVIRCTDNDPLSPELKKDVIRILSAAALVANP